MGDFYWPELAFLMEVFRELFLILKVKVKVNSLTFSIQNYYVCFFCIYSHNHIISLFWEILSFKINTGFFYVDLPLWRIRWVCDCAGARVTLGEG